MQPKQAHGDSGSNYDSAQVAKGMQRLRCEPTQACHFLGMRIFCQHIRLLHVLSVCLHICMSVACLHSVIAAWVAVPLLDNEAVLPPLSALSRFVSGVAIKLINSISATW